MELRSMMLECDLASQEASEFIALLSFVNDKLHKELPSDYLLEQQNGQKGLLTRSFADNETTLLGSNGSVLPSMFTDSLSETHDRTDQNVAACSMELEFQVRHRTADAHVMQQVLPPSNIVDCMDDGDCVVEQALPPTPRSLIETALVAPNLLPAPHASITPAVPEIPAQMHELEASVTTLLIRHIPQSISQEDLLALWPPSWGYNMLHVPYNFKQRRSGGYVFINFISNEAARLFFNTWQGRGVAKQGRTNKITIRAALVQGLMPNLQHLQQNGIGSVINDKYLPALFIRERRISFKSVFQQMGDERLLPGTSQESYLNPQEMEW